MIAYEATKQEFIQDVYNNKIIKKILDGLGFKGIASTEKEAWMDIASQMERVLRDPTIPEDITIAMEFRLYKSNMRIDFMLAGLNENRKNTIILMEFKRWTRVKVQTDRDDMVNTIKWGIQEHPSYQALSYAKTIENTYEAITNYDIQIKPCSCLHRYEKTQDNAIRDEYYKDLLQQSPVFLQGENDKIIDFIKRYMKYGDNKQTLHLLEESDIKPLKRLQDSILPIIRGESEFSMVGIQKDIFEEAKRLARLSKKDGKKRVYIVEGGPGTGKSVIAVNLLGELLQKHKMNCQYIAKNQNLRNVFTDDLKGAFKKKVISKLFRGSGSYRQETRNQYHALIVDESHRITKKTGFFKQGNNQIQEIIDASLFSMFFIDPKQRIHIDDYGTIERIKKFAKNEKAEVKYGKLEMQFRCAGVDEYIHWVEACLQYEDSNLLDIDSNFLEKYHVEICDDPNDMREKIREHNKGRNKSRIVAGDCWNWITRNEPESDKYDIIIPKYNFKMKWNFHKTAWAIEENSVEQAGCIHTSQGLEFDYVGVIIGNDMRYENGKIITDYTKREQRDRTNGTLRGIKKLYNENPKQALKIADEIIKNTYRVLLTRGQRGCYIYCEDKNLAEYLKKRLE